MRALVLVDSENNGLRCPSEVGRRFRLFASQIGRADAKATIVFAVAVDLPSLGRFSVDNFEPGLSLEVWLVPSAPEAADLAFEEALTAAVSIHAAGPHDLVMIVSEDRGVRGVLTQAPELRRGWAPGQPAATAEFDPFRVAWHLYVRGTPLMRTASPAPSAGDGALRGELVALYPMQAPNGLASATPILSALVPNLAARSVAGSARIGPLGPGTVDVDGELLWSRLPAAALPDPVPVSGLRVDDQAVLRSVWTDSHPCVVRARACSRSSIVVRVQRGHLSPPHAWWSDGKKSTARLKSRLQFSGCTVGNASVSQGELVFRAAVPAGTTLRLSPPGSKARPLPHVVGSGGYRLLMLALGDEQSHSWKAVQDIDPKRILARRLLRPDQLRDARRLPLLVSASHDTRVPMPSGETLRRLAADEPGNAR